MDDLKQEDLWFNTPDSHTLCRAGKSVPFFNNFLLTMKFYGIKKALIDFPFILKKRLTKRSKEYRALPYPEGDIRNIPTTLTEIEKMIQSDT